LAQATRKPSRTGRGTGWRSGSPPAATATRRPSRTGRAQPTSPTCGDGGTVAVDSDTSVPREPRATPSPRSSAMHGPYRPRHVQAGMIRPGKDLDRAPVPLTRTGRRQREPDYRPGGSRVRGPVDDRAGDHVGAVEGEPRVA